MKLLHLEWGLVGASIESVTTLSKNHEHILFDEMDMIHFGEYPKPHFKNKIGEHKCL